MKRQSDEVWTRQPGESVQAFQAFAAYRDLGPDRSLTRVAQTLSKSRPLMSRWSERWQWVKRAAAWDAELDRQNRAEQEKARRDMADRQARQAMLFQEKVLQRLRRMNPEELSPADLARWFDVATKIERLARGEPTEKVEAAGQVTHRHETDFTERLQRYENLYARLAASDRAFEGDDAGDDPGESVHPA